MGSAANLAAVSHLRPVPDPQPPRRSEEAEPSAPSIAELERWATVLRAECVRMLAVAKSGHLDSSLSAADLVTALYYRVLRHDPERPDWPARDRFVLCKGHAAPIQYAALAHHGYFPPEDLMGLRRIGAQLQGHPDMNRTAGVEVSTGSLGQGLSMCVGICLALRLDDLADTAHVFGILSDGDCQEGQTWEAATAAAHFGVDEPDGDRRLQPPADRRHHGGGHGHRRRAGEVRVVRLGCGRDRRPRHGRDRRGAGAQPHAGSPGGDRRADQEGPRRLLHGGPLRLPRQAADSRAGGGGAHRARGEDRGADEGADGERSS